MGTGRPTTLLELLALLRREIADIEPEVLGRFREGDVRSCYADISRIRQILGFEPQVRLEDGVPSLAAWVAEALESLWFGQSSSQNPKIRRLPEIGCFD